MSSRTRIDLSSCKPPWSQYTCQDPYLLPGKYNYTAEQLSRNHACKTVASAVSTGWVQTNTYRIIPRSVRVPDSSCSKQLRLGLDKPPSPVSWRFPSNLAPLTLNNLRQRLVNTAGDRPDPQVCRLNYVGMEQSNTHRSLNKKTFMRDLEKIHYNHL